MRISTVIAVPIIISPSVDNGLNGVWCETALFLRVEFINTSRALFDLFGFSGGLDVFFHLWSGGAFELNVSMLFPCIEPENHLFEKEHHLPNLRFGYHTNCQRCKSLLTLSENWEGLDVGRNLILWWSVVNGLTFRVAIFGYSELASL